MSYTSAKSRPTFTFDANLEMKDAGLVAASAAATVDSAAKVLDMGTGYFEGTLVIDITACEAASNDEGYKIAWEVSDQSGFSAGSEFEVVAFQTGDASLHGGDAD